MIPKYPCAPSTFSPAFFYHDLRTGRYAGALATLEKAGAAVRDNTIARLYNLELEGWIYAEMGRLDEARKTATSSWA